MTNFYPYLHKFYVSLARGVLTQVSLYISRWLVMLACLGVSAVSFASTHSVIFKVTKLGFSLDAKPLESNYGEKVTLLAKVEGRQPTGKLVFYYGEQPLGEAILKPEDNGSTSFEIDSVLDVGTHRLIAHYFNEKHSGKSETAEVTITVKPVLIMLKLADVVTTYAPNKTLQLDQPESPSKGEISYHIAEAEQRIATVDKHGLVTIHDGGVAQITVKQAANGNYQEFTGTFKLVINPGEGGIKLTPGTGIMILE